MHDFLWSLPIWGFFLGALGTICTMEGSIRTAVICLAVCVASFAWIKTHGDVYGID